MLGGGPDGVPESGGGHGGCDRPRDERICQDLDESLAGACGSGEEGGERQRAGISDRVGEGRPRGSRLCNDGVDNGAQAGEAQAEGEEWAATAKAKRTPQAKAAARRAVARKARAKSRVTAKAAAAKASARTRG